MSVVMDILLVDDHPLFRHGLRSLITDAYPDARIREAGSIADAAMAADEMKRGILLLDITLPDGDGLSFASELLSTGAAWRVFILTMHKRTGLLHNAHDIGCRGYFLKEGDGSDLLLALVDDGVDFKVSSRLEGLAAAPTSGDSAAGYMGLTRREKEIFRFFSMGRNYKEVAAELGISPRTATSHRYNIFRKLGVHTDLDLANIARELGIIT